GYIGVGVREVDADLAKELQLPKAGGVQITRLYAGAPGAKAKLKIGDVILSIAGKPIKDSRDLQTIVADLPLNKAADVIIVRDGKRQTKKVVVALQPETFGSRKTPTTAELARKAVAVDKIGIEVLELTDQVANLLGYTDAAEGVVVWSMERRGLGARAGLRPGWLIQSVDGKKVTTPKQLVEAIRKGSTTKGITLKVQVRGGATRTVVVKK